MTIATREQVMTALFALLQSAAGFASYTRVAQFDVNQLSGNLPALVLYERRDATPQSVIGAPPKRVMFPMVVVVGQVPETSAPPAPPGMTLLNPLIDAVETALLPDFKGRLTLGQLVYWVRRDGQIMKNSGDVEGAGRFSAYIPLRITIP